LTGGTLRVSWRRVPGASGYAVTLRLDDHTSRFLHTTRPAAMVTAVPAGVAVTIEVRAIQRSLIRSLGLAAHTRTAAARRLHVVIVAPI
jgi:hypothetical protein